MAASCLQQRMRLLGHLVLEFFTSETTKLYTPEAASITTKRADSEHLKIRLSGGHVDVTPSHMAEPSTFQP